MGIGQKPIDRLSTTDEKGNRLFVYPADVRGRFHTRKLILNAVLIAVFLLLPWLKVGGHQAVLLDIPHRRFAIFGLTFWAHDAPMVFFFVGGFALLLFLVTAIWGRVWCGWACPQTVFVDGVFRQLDFFLSLCLLYYPPLW
jgi:polyferredoxin